jgi:hypothetical protein
MNEAYQPPHFPGLVNSELRDRAQHVSFDFWPEKARDAARTELKRREALKINYVPLESVNARE